MQQSTENKIKELSKQAKSKDWFNGVGIIQERTILIFTNRCLDEQEILEFPKSIDNIPIIFQYLPENEGLIF